ncbi:putative ribonuclease H protein [Vitis vinifera]|uniref:Putative ribonuclease H protein n=1 Tax=Vitis vinifera TaxID=29760 RepID=A0A438EK76_VITVI|nr:putative ribonuclease H protein [Vitis vinifera]
MEAFSSLLRKAVAGGFVSACKARSRGGEGVNVSHLLFADDTLVFCGATKVQLLHLNWILMWFEAMSGLRINLDKSAQYRSRAVWDGVEERMRKKLARWKSQYISKGGRITLIRSTLANMPIYFMSMLSMPRKVRLRLERIQREFLWGGGALERKIHLVKWELVCLEKDNGGLGVKSLFILNKALLCKWSWRFAMEREAFWNQVIRGKIWGGARGMEFKGSKGGDAWKQIQQGVDDRVIWRETKCGMFSVKSLYKSLVSGHPISFPSSAIWKVTVQPKWVLPATVKETLSGWKWVFCGEERKGVWKASPLCLFWTVWKTRNKVAFEEKELSIQRLKASFVYFLWSETKRSIKDGPSTLVDFVGWVASR